MADMDEDLISALRKLKEGTLQYGKKSMLFLPTANDMASTNRLLILNVLFLTVSSIPKMAIVVRNLARRWIEGFQNRSGYMYPLHTIPILFRKGPFLLASFVP